MVVNKLAHWIKVKKYPDDFSIAEDTECEYGFNEEDMEGDYPCNCECKRKNKVLDEMKYSKLISNNFKSNTHTYCL